MRRVTFPLEVRIVLFLIAFMLVYTFGALGYIFVTNFP